MPQTVEEKTAEAKVDTSKTEDIDWRIEYPDEFYEEYIEKFEQTKKKKYFYRFVKRAFDIFVSLLGLIIASPLFLGIAIAIKIDSKGPVIFKQDRVGRGGKVFKCLKFRSMKIDAPHDCPTMDLQNPERHYTKVGKFIRKLSRADDSTVRTDGEVFTFHGGRRDALMSGGILAPLLLFHFHGNHLKA